METVGQQFRQLLDSAGDAFFLCDDRGEVIVDVNKHACDSLGYTRDELLSLRIADIDVEFVPRNLVRYLTRPDEEYPFNFEGIQRRKDGTTFPVEIRLTSVVFDGRRLLFALVRDISERKQTEEALRKEQRLLQDMLDLHERDRKLVAYEIHDGLAQQLTGAIFKFESVEQLQNVDERLAKEMFASAVRLLREAVAETRRLISGLRPPALDEEGVTSAIEYLISDYRRHGGPEIEFIHWPQGVRFSPPLEIAIFRIVQECLTNACRHSRSDRVWIELSLGDNCVRIEVRDRGVGFDADAVDRDRFGLQGIRERARLLGGRVSMESAPQKGARIYAELPLVMRNQSET